MTDTMQPTQELNEAQRFFFDHAGYSWNPKTETPEQGRTRGAIALEVAERIVVARMDAEDISYTWEHDDIDSSDHEDTDEPYALWLCCLRVEGMVAEALGGIDLGRDGQPGGNPHARVCEAEMAVEWLAAEKVVQAEAEREYLRGAGPDDTPDDTPSLANCDDAGTGEGRFHGRM